MKEETNGKDIIRVEELSKNFGEHQVLRKIDFFGKQGRCYLYTRFLRFGKIHTSALHKSA